MGLSRWGVGALNSGGGSGVVVVVVTIGTIMAEFATAKADKSSGRDCMRLARRKKNRRLVAGSRVSSGRTFSATGASGKSGSILCVKSDLRLAILL